MSLSDMQRCIQECLRCHGVCLTAIAHCLRKGGRHADPNHITTMLDCVEMFEDDDEMRRCAAECQR